MKTNNNKLSKVRRFFSRRQSTRHNPWLILNIEEFNVAAGWSHLLGRQQVRQFVR